MLVKMRNRSKLEIQPLLHVPFIDVNDVRSIEYRETTGFRKTGFMSLCQSFRKCSAQAVMHATRCFCQRLRVSFADTYGDIKSNSNVCTMSEPCQLSTAECLSQIITKQPAAMFSCCKTLLKKSQSSDRTQLGQTELELNNRWQEGREHVGP